MRCIVEYDAAPGPPLLRLFIYGAPHRRMHHRLICSSRSPSRFRSSTGQSLGLRSQRSAFDSPRKLQYTALIGQGAEAVLKPVRTARYEGRDLSAPPTRKANRSGTGAGWKPRGRGNSVGIVR